MNLRMAGAKGETGLWGGWGHHREADSGSFVTQAQSQAPRESDWLSMQHSAHPLGKAW